MSKGDVISIENKTLTSYRDIANAFGNNCTNSKKGYLSWKNVEILKIDLKESFKRGRGNEANLNCF